MHCMYTIYLGAPKSLRESVYRAFITRASNGEANNEPVISKILSLKKEMAGILGYNTYAEVMCCILSY
jgi:oligopeptidase A